MKIIITSKMAESLIAMKLFVSMNEVMESKLVDVVDELPPGSYDCHIDEIHLIDNVTRIEFEKPILTKEPSWVRLNRGKISKKERRKHKF